MRRISRFASLLLTALLFHLSTPALAYEVEPMGFKLSSSEASPTGFAIRNTGDDAIALEISAIERATGADAMDRFMMFPPQAVIPPGRSQTVRVQWIGGPVAEGKRYNFIVKQVPVDVNAQPTGSQVAIHVTYKLQVAVLP